MILKGAGLTIKRASKAEDYRFFVVRDKVTLDVLAQTVMFYFNRNLEVVEQKQQERQVWPHCELVTITNNANSLLWGSTSIIFVVGLLHLHHVSFYYRWMKHCKQAEDTAGSDSGGCHARRKGQVCFCCFCFILLFKGVDSALLWWYYMCCSRMEHSNLPSAVKWLLFCTQ